MRAFGRDLIRGGHYGQRSCEPHLKAEHMAAPTNAAKVKKALANSEPSTHGTNQESPVHAGARSRQQPATNLLQTYMLLMKVRSFHTTKTRSSHPVPSL